MSVLLVSLYVIPLLYLVGSSLAQARLAWHFYRRKQPSLPLEATKLDFPLPRVTVQLPLYNERYVVERLLVAIAALDYPGHLLEIQVLDDSTDETTTLIEQQLDFIRQQGITIKHLQRADRTGFKAGALAQGTRQATGEFIAIFDADFLPAPDFLLRLLPYFTNPRVGLVQARWDHLNATDSLLTRFQGFFLDAHLFVEQWGRQTARHLINFNGTAGIWRKACIDDAGGWHADTLTEDLDLSYRAQLRGWQFNYAGDVGVLAELPLSMQALKTQQFRWMKGIAECARKHLGPTLQSSRLRPASKGYAFFHLLSSLPFCCLLVLGLTSVPLLWLEQQPAYRLLLGQISGVAVLSLASISLYWSAFTFRKPARNVPLLSFMGHYGLFMVFSMGLSLHNAQAVVAGFAGRKSAFVRTPKFNQNAAQSSWRQNRYLLSADMKLSWGELFLCLYFLGAIGLGFYWQNFSFMPLHLLFVTGFGLVSYYSIGESVASRPAKEAVINDFVSDQVD
jgi:cellulose synthase/poly-beta-1,6-N-acetylglucosamine synthase-like glycosyltransferase